MDEKTVRALLLRHFEHSGSDPDLAHDMYEDGAVLEFPQSGERFDGVANFKEWRSGYPASTSFEIREVRGAGDLWIAEGTITYDDGPPNFAVTILEFRGEKIVRESIYVGEGWEAPEWRKRWRAAP